LKHNANSATLENRKLGANIQLTPTAEQAKSVRDTLERCNGGCNMISQRSFQAGTTR
jgi:hypothetical protein